MKASEVYAQIAENIQCDLVLRLARTQEVTDKIEAALASGHSFGPRTFRPIDFDPCDVPSVVAALRADGFEVEVEKACDQIERRVYDAICITVPKGPQ